MLQVNTGGTTDQKTVGHSFPLMPSLRRKILPRICLHKVCSAHICKIHFVYSVPRSDTLYGKGGPSPCSPPSPSGGAQGSWFLLLRVRCVFCLPHTIFLRSGFSLVLCLFRFPLLFSFMSILFLPPAALSLADAPFTR